MTSDGSKRAGLLEDLRRGPGEHQLNARLLRRRSNLGAEKKVVDRGEDHAR